MTGLVDWWQRGWHWTYSAFSVTVGTEPSL